jgi:hypothetical protein
LKKLLLSALFLMLLSGILIWYISGDILFNYLSLNKPVDKANLLILEGWLYDDEVKEAIELYKQGSYPYIITTGVNTPPFFMMGMNGDLVVDVKHLHIKKGMHELTIRAFSSLANNESGLFDLWADEIKIGGSYTTRKPDDYAFNFEADSTTDSITISFKNDALYKDEDINFYISFVTIDDSSISVNDTLNYYRTLVKPYWKNILASNHATRLKHVLMQYGIPANKIIPIETHSYNESRTAETAKNTIHQIDSIFNIDTLKVNIFSRKPHTRRTFNAYKKYATHNMQIGIIPSTCYISKIERGRFRNIKEMAGIIYLKINPF